MTRFQHPSVFPNQKMGRFNRSPGPDGHSMYSSIMTTSLVIHVVGSNAWLLQFHGHEAGRRMVQFASQKVRNMPTASQPLRSIMWGMNSVKKKGMYVWVKNRGPPRMTSGSCASTSILTATIRGMHGRETAAMVGDDDCDGITDGSSNRSSIR
jgi:hypothetical protein